MIILVCILTFIAVFSIVYTFFLTSKGLMHHYEAKYLSNTSEMLTEMYMVMPPERMLLFKFLSCTLCTGLTIFGSRNFIFPVPYILPVVIGAASLFIPDVVLKFILKKRRKAFNKQMPNAMNTITNGLRSGFSFLQSLQLAADRLPDPAGEEFRIAMRQVELGVTIENALISMGKRVQDEDMRLMITATKLTMETGGDLPSVYKKMTETIRDRSRIDGKIKSLTAQGKMQALIVGLLPVILFFIMLKVNTQLMSLMYTTLIGWLLIAVVAILDILGYFLIRRIIAIRL